MAVAGNVGTPLSLARRVARPGRDRDRLRGVELPARGRDRVRARARAAAEPGGGPPRPPRHASRPTARPSCACSRNQGAGDVAVAPAGLGLDAAGRDVRAPGGPRASATAAAGRRAAAAADEIRLRGPHNLENAMGAAAAALARGVPGDGGGAALRDVRAACRTGSRRSREVDGVLYVNDSKATNVARGACAASRPSRAACTRSSAAASRAAASRGCASRWRSAAARAT